MIRKIKIVHTTMRLKLFKQINYRQLLCILIDQWSLTNFRTLLVLIKVVRNILRMMMMFRTFMRLTFELLWRKSLKCNESIQHCVKTQKNLHNINSETNKDGRISISNWQDQKHSLTLLNGLCEMDHHVTSNYTREHLNNCNLVINYRILINKPVRVLIC